MRLTHKQVIATIKAMGLSCRVHDGEFRVNYPHGAEPTAYYTDDAEDAIGTARIGFPRHAPTPSPVTLQDWI